MVSYKKQIVFLIISVIVCIVILVSIYREVKKQTINELNNRQMVYANLAANGIEESFNHHIQTLNSLASDDHIVRMDSHGQTLVKSFQQMSADEIRGVTRLDASGKIVYSFPDVKGSIGTDISSQEHIRDLLQNKKPVISDVFNAIQGFQAVAVHVPVFRNKAFDGSLALLISFDALAKKYLRDIKVENSGYAWMISEKGIEIYCPIPGHVGNSVLANCKDFPDIIAMAREMMKGKTGVTTYTFDQTGKTVIPKAKKHAVYMPVKLGNTFWSIVVATPEDTVLATMKSFGNQLALITVILLLVFAAIAYLIARIRSTNIEQQKRRAIEDDLIKSAGEINDLYHNAPCGYHSLDSGGNIVRMNDMALSWLGYTRGELVGKSYTHILSEASRDRFASAFARLKEQGLVRDVDYEMLRKDGTTFPVLVTASAIMDDQGNFVMSRSMVLDITLRRKQEERLRENEELYRTALEKTNDGISIVQDGKYVYVNKKLMETIGRPDDNLIGKTAGIYIHPEDRKLLAENYLATVRGLPTPNRTYDLRVLKPDGSTVIVSVVNVLITYHGAPATLAFIADITQKKNYETALRESEELYRTALESTSDGVTIVQKGKYVYVSQRLLDTIGQPDLNLVGSMQSSDIDPDDWAKVTEAYERRRKGGPIPTGYELRVAKPDQSIVYLHVDTVPVKYHGARAMLSFIRDITRQKETENALRESEALYRTAMESTSDGVSIVQNGKYVYVSQRLLYTIGRQDLNLIGTPQGSFIHPDDWAKVIEAYRFRRKGEPIFTDYELRVAKPDQSIAYLHVNAAIVIYHGKSAILSFIRDITKQKETENALRESEELYRTALESTSDGITITDATEGKYMYVNQKLMNTLGRPGESIIGGPADLYVHPEYVGLGKKHFLERNKSGKKVSYLESRIVRPDESVAMLSVTALDIIFQGRKAVLSFCQDITEKKQQEQALHESEALYRTAMESTSDGVSIIDIRTGRYLYANQRLMDTIGRPAENITGQPVDIYLHPEDVDVGRNSFPAKKASGTDRVYYEIRALKPDGAVVILGITATETTYQGKPAVISFISDITERKRTEEALRESEELYRTALEKTNDGISIVQDGKYAYVNQKLLKTLAREETQIVNQPLGVYFHPDDLDKVKKYNIARIQGEDAPSSYDIRVMKPDGSYVTINVNAVRIVYQGKPATLSFVIDVTERRRAEEALRQSEERYRNIIESIDDDYFETDLSGSITFFNKPIGWSGYSREELTSMKFHQYVKPEMAEKIITDFNKIYLKGKPAHITNYEIIRKDGSIGHLEMSISLIRNAEGNPTGFRGISRDVSDRFKMEEEHKRLSEQLYQAQKMEAIGTLAGGIAHDFNNLLMGIQGYTSLMLLAVNKTQPHYEQLKAVQTLVQSGANLTRQLLGFARVGRYEVVPTDLNDLISKSINLFGRTRKEIRIFEKYAENVWTVEADRGQIDQVLLNIFVNAWQAMPGGGSLYLETGNVVFDDTPATIHDLKPGRYVKSSITDTGVGMDEKTRQRIFDPFFTTKEMGRGTGLGLASAYGIIKGHGGVISVYSEKGQGTTFNIYLPASSKNVIPEEYADPNLARGCETILLVDDEEVITDVTGKLLTELGYQIITAGSGNQAIEIYAQNHADIDLVIIDMIMPGMSGSDTFDQLKAINPSVRAILSSGYSLNGKAQAIMDRGVRVFLQKPYRPHDLAQKIREALSTQSISRIS